MFLPWGPQPPRPHEEWGGCRRLVSLLQRDHVLSRHFHTPLPCVTQAADTAWSGLGICHRVSVSPPAFKTNSRCENAASRNMCEEGNKKMKWLECPEARPGACGAATVNK